MNKSELGDKLGKQTGTTSVAAMDGAIEFSRSAGQWRGSARPPFPSLRHKESPLLYLTESSHLRHYPGRGKHRTRLQVTKTLKDFVVRTGPSRTGVGAQFGRKDPRGLWSLTLCACDTKTGVRVRLGKANAESGGTTAEVGLPRPHS